LTGRASRHVVRDGKVVGSQPEADPPLAESPISSTAKNIGQLTGRASRHVVRDGKVVGSQPEADPRQPRCAERRAGAFGGEPDQLHK